jgi:hypothetical protein
MNMFWRWVRTLVLFGSPRPVAVPSSLVDRVRCSTAPLRPTF